MSHWQPLLSQIDPETAFAPGDCCIPLAHLGCIDIEGSQCDNLLQGQFTCNLKALDQEHWSMGAHCTPKGRMISNFILHRIENGCRLVLSQDLEEAQNRALAKYSPLYRGQAEVKARGEALLGIGLIGQAALEIVKSLGLDLPEPGQQLQAGKHQLLRMSDGERLMIWSPADAALTLWNQLSEQLSPALPERWQLAEVQQGRALVSAALSDRFIPQQLNLQALGGVSFNKGCYTGQEIVARLEYRGKQKNHLHRIRVEAPLAPSGSALVRSDNGNEAGELINSAALGPDQFEALALIRDSDLEDGDIRLLDSNGKAVSLLEFPYTVENK